MATAKSQPPKNLLSRGTHNLTGAKVEGQDRPLLLVSFFAGRVYMTALDKSKNIKTTFGLPINQLGTLYESMYALVQSEGSQMHRFVMRKSVRGDDNRSKISEVGVLIIGRGEDGYCYIGVKNTEGKATQFKFMSDYMMQAVDKDGNALRIPDVSNNMAMGWMRSLYDIAVSLAVQDQPDNNNSGGSSKGNYSSKSSSSSVELEPDNDFDDIDF